MSSFECFSEVDVRKLDFFSLRNKGVNGGGFYCLLYWIFKDNIYVNKWINVVVGCSKVRNKVMVLCMNIGNKVLFFNVRNFSKFLNWWESISREDMVKDIGYEVYR